MKDTLIKEYNNTQILNIKNKPPQNTFKVNFINGAFFEIIGSINEKYKVIFTDQKNNKIIHETTITNNMWTRTNIKYCVDWKIEALIESTNEKVFEYKFNPTGKHVYIHIDSKAIGDHLAWFPYIEEFRKKWNCKVTCSTFHNQWFKSSYPQLNFTNPGTEVFDIYAMFEIGWFYNNNKVDLNRIPLDFKRYPLQQTASEILNVKYKEVKPILDAPLKKTDIQDKYVVIAPHASAHAKYWNYPGGWQTIIDYLNNKGYKVVMLTAEPLGDEWHDSKLGGTLTGVINKTGFDIPLEDRMIDIRDASLFIGMGSGLSWVSWALNTPTILISGFSYPYTEFQDCERIYPLEYNACVGCFNRHKLNAGDWEWCPDHKNTPRQFECTKLIKPEQVIESINKQLSIKEKKIKIFHLLTRPEDEREKRSIESISQLGQYKNIEYNQIINTPYTETPPKENCLRPDDISPEPGYYKLSPGHYGCYKAHTDAILSCPSDKDYICIFFECDAVLNVAADDFVNKLYNAIDLCEKYNYTFFNFSKYHDMINDFGDHVSAKRFVEAHSYLIPGDKIDKVKNIILNSLWDVFDLWVNSIMYDEPKGFFKNNLVSQAKGYSLIDKKYTEVNGIGEQKV